MMLKLLLAAIAIPALLCGCATKDPGWKGLKAEPFDASLAECKQKASIVADPKNREHILEDCMAAKGWSRPVH